MRPIERARDRWKSLSTRDGCGMEPADWVRVSEMMDAYEADRKELLELIRDMQREFATIRKNDLNYQDNNYHAGLIERADKILSQEQGGKK